MNRPNAVREVWQPHTAQDRDVILRELQAILASPQFCNSKRYPALLEYIVKHTLAGRSDLLKERTLGVEVFHRPPTYDTNTDTVVRYTAGEVRKRLLLYYSEHGYNSPIRISLPPGSYIPEFTYAHEDREDSHSEPAGVELQPEAERHISSSELSSVVPPETPITAPVGAVAPASHLPIEKMGRKRIFWMIAAAVISLAGIIAGIVWRARANNPPSALEVFWAPVLRDTRQVMICTGSVIFAQNNYSGVTTAGRDLDYTFVSMQIASAITQISDVTVSSGASSQLVSSASTPLTELREHPLVLLGAYNNQWTLRLLDPLRFHFSPRPGEVIVDQTQPGVKWRRDESQPYSSADDYAIVARFHDPTIDGWVVAIAGLGRNGTEAAAQFATSPHYLQLLRDQVGSGGFANKNLETVLKVNVIDGKSGAPSILAVYSW